MLLYNNTGKAFSFGQLYTVVYKTIFWPSTAIIFNLYENHQQKESKNLNKSRLVYLNTKVIHQYPPKHSPISMIVLRCIWKEYDLQSWVKSW